VEDKHLVRDIRHPLCRVQTPRIELSEQPAVVMSS
jgi:hypothetical protein